MFESDTDLIEAKRHSDKFKAIARMAQEDLVTANDGDCANVLASMWEDYFPNVNINSEVEAAKMNRWLNALTKYPPDLVRLAYINWFEQDLRGFPPKNAGQLMASVQGILTARRVLLQKASIMGEVLQRHKDLDFDPATRVTTDQIAKIDVKLKRIPPPQKKTPVHEQMKELQKHARDNPTPKKTTLTPRERRLAMSLGKTFRAIAELMQDQKNEH